ncbi:serine/threonine-protein phosphatase 7 long form homolog [Carex rostrata]
MENARRVQGSGQGKPKLTISGVKRSRERSHAPPVAAAPSGDPTDPSLLKLQADHRSKKVIEGEFLDPLTTREHLVALPWDDRYEPYVIRAGLYGVHQIGHIPTDHALVSALVERWRQETHSFHFPVGEMTITLQDVAVLLGLRVDGDALCVSTNRDWSDVVESMLGKRVDKTTFRPKSKVAINISWLRNNFSECAPSADRVTVKQYARAYCLMLVGSLLFTDHSGDSISAIYLPLFANFDRAGRYSWASGVLAYLYKELCLATKPKRKQFGGSILLLQLWSWERLPMGRPKNRRNFEEPQLGGEDLIRRPPLGYGWSNYHTFAGHVTCRVQDSYRLEIDALNDGKVVWLPYENKMHLLPPICLESPHLWRTTAPLIHFWIVEMYNPGRVARQFGRYQQIPPVLHDTVASLHKLINGTGKNWPEVHRKYLLSWRNREGRCLIDQRPYDPSEHEQYMRWFSGDSILYLQSPGGVPNTYSSANSIRQIAASIVERYREVTDEETRAFARGLLHLCKEAIKDLLEPIDDDIFAFFDNRRIQQQLVRPVHGDDPGPSSRPSRMRAEGPATT